MQKMLQNGGVESSGHVSVPSSETFSFIDSLELLSTMPNCHVHDLCKHVAEQWPQQFVNRSVSLFSSTRVILQFSRLTAVGYPVEIKLMLEFDPTWR